MDSLAFAAGLAAARRVGLPTGEPVVLAEGANLVVHFRPALVVARISRVHHFVRPISAMASGVALARALGDVMVPPSTVVDPGPHTQDGRYVTFWAYAPEAPASSVEAGRALRVLHDRASTYRGGLRHFDPRPEALRISDLIGGEAADILRSSATHLELPSMLEQPIHGDAHHENALRGGRWLDADEMCLGPREWDLACLQHRRWLWGEIQRETDEALRGYGPHDEARVAALGPAVVLFIAAWGSLAPLVGESVGPRTTRRLQWLRAHA